MRLGRIGLIGVILLGAALGGAPVQPAMAADTTPAGAASPIGGDLVPTVQRFHMWFFLTGDNDGTADYHRLWNPSQGSYFGMLGDIDGGADDSSETLAYDGFGRWWFDGPREMATFGIDGDHGFVGDWDGDGIDTLGVWRNGAWFLRNDIASGIADVAFGYGNPTDVPVVGDWDGDGIDTVGVFRDGSWYLADDITHTVADRVVPFNQGTPSESLCCGDWHTVVQDWDSDGDDDLGIKWQSGWYLDLDLTGGTPEIVFGYGDGTDRPLVHKGDPSDFGD